jgi:hypothetical protein
LVTNKNSGPGFEPFTDTFDGEDWEFPSGETVEVPVLVAQHLFGFGFTEDSLGHLAALRRKGWNLLKDSNGHQIGELILSKFEIQSEEPEAA